MTTTIVNRHERTLPAGSEVLAPSLDGLGSSTDRLWPHRDWPAIEFEGAIGIGVEGRHGPIHYRLTEYEPGRLLHFTFLPSLTLEPRGHHRFELHPVSAARSLLRHELQLVDPSPGVVLMWHLVIEPLHDALIEDLLDNAVGLTSDRAAGSRDTSGTAPASVGSGVCRTGWSRRVRLMRPVALPLLASLG
ncbi:MULTISPECIES: hypothetical protein [unclassified Pseudonocardia]|uniref:hypothetical protein n=1 Tax=unclassified Pseudonocardia TaxID=2619320 RepID=UPI0001FFEDF1|nr:hypothetical protein [Pseudonocardia sp. Ae707_Ps1]OLM20332.1 hypothetical protein Ae707Ps1_4591c [Pseudonocardia sp. Ae707_Ps1]